MELSTSKLTNIQNSSNLKSLNTFPSILYIYEFIFSYFKGISAILLLSRISFGFSLVVFFSHNFTPLFYLDMILSINFVQLYKAIPIRE